MTNLSMKLLSSAAIAVAGLMALPTGAAADELAAFAGQTVILRGYHGTVYYAPRGADFVVVVTMDNAGQPVRFVTSLKPGQRAKISTPGAQGEADAAVVFRRDGDQLFVDDHPRPKPAGALHSKALFAD